MFSKSDIVRIVNKEGNRKCLIIPGFMQYPDFYDEEATEMPYGIVDILDLRWSDKDMVKDRMQLQFIEGLYRHILIEKYDVIYVHGISDSIIYKLQFHGELHADVVFICPYCIPEEIRQKQYNFLCLYLKFRKHLSAKIQLALFKWAVSAEDEYFALYLLNSMKQIKSSIILRRFEDSLVSVNETEQLEGFFIYGEDDRYSWAVDDEYVVEDTGHYPLNEKFIQAMHKIEGMLLEY